MLAQGFPVLITEIGGCSSSVIAEPSPGGDYKGNTLIRRGIRGFLAYPSFSPTVIRPYGMAWPTDDPFRGLSGHSL
jgi:hypothetical protein